MNALIPLWRRAITAEVCWLTAEGDPAAVAATPLLDRDVPCVALPYSRAGEVAGLRDAEQVAFAVTDSRSLRPGVPAMAVVGAVSVLDDTEGDHFVVELLKQELVKFPPTRTLADSPLLCRENWWWLPRLIIRLERVTRLLELPPRTNPARHGLLVRERDATLAPGVVEVLDGRHDRLPLRDAGGKALRGDGGPALVFGYDYSMPDLERWETWSRGGRLLGDELVVERRSGSPDADLSPLSLLGRVRRQREMSRECKRNILAAQRRG
ncbi:hypothetical protein SacmaDRAFT_1714 [Saccharomonospora marina XMU15]|uniref:Uncharacterized protein n=1 Tax=Saccharomonospora marina XMU15 TaxID=882083 RepID=H5X4I2_9PSEU|nr:hypothetical protein [Saccharomonospora marina]EHR49984.1 hypothetical protein SacmaDRAFT_1714 [Saccharomonospora marina XMU15]